MGKVVRARGRIAVFVGDSTASFLYQDKNVLIVQCSEQYLSMDLPGGEEVEAVGVFGVETHRDREYGVLKDARIDRLAGFRSIEKFKEQIRKDSK